MVMFIWIRQINSHLTKLIRNDSGKYYLHKVSLPTPLLI